MFTSWIVIVYKDILPFEQETANSLNLGQAAGDHKQTSGPFSENFDDPSHPNTQASSILPHARSEQSEALSPVLPEATTTPVQYDRPVQSEAQLIDQSTDGLA